MQQEKINILKIKKGDVAKLLMLLANSNKGGQPPPSLHFGVTSRERMGGEFAG